MHCLHNSQIKSQQSLRMHKQNKKQEEKEGTINNINVVIFIKYNDDLRHRITNSICRNCSSKKENVIIFLEIIPKRKIAKLIRSADRRLNIRETFFF